MKKSEPKTFSYNLLFFFLPVIFLYISCGDSGRDEYEEQTDTQAEYAIKDSVGNITNSEEPVGSSADEFQTAGDKNEAPDSEYQNQTIEKETNESVSQYIVDLSTKSELMHNETGEFTVWIGSDKYLPERSGEKISDKSTIPAEIGQFAKITPRAPDFDVEPLEYKCIEIHPSRSEVSFNIRPRKEGTLKISANIEIYKEEGCKGTPVPKTTKTLSVNVKVNTKVIILGKLKELLAITWDKFLSFWGILITTLFAALIVIIRARLKGKSNDSK